MDHARTFVTSDGVRLAYRLWRPGPPRQTLVLIHGLASNHTRWSELVAMTRLRESWDLLRPDLRGFGQSIARTQVGLEVWSRDLAAVLAAEQAPPAVVAGHCLGANVALVFATRFPAAAHRFVLIEPMFREALTGGLRLAARLRPPAAMVGALARTLNAVGVYRRRLPPLDLEQLDREARAAMAKGGPSAFPEARYGSVLEDLRYTPTAVYLDGLRAVTGALPDLKTIAAPSLSLLSTGGRFGDPAITARLLGELRRGEVRMLEARHWIPTESPVQMRQAIEEWCERT
jgi:pimeloyl-ACP methyl ester carboxylesterase